MKINITRHLAALAALFAFSASAYAESYIRPEILWSQGKESDGDFSSSKMGFGLVGGITLGDQAEHDISVGISATNYSHTYTDGTLDLKTVPIMLNYRYIFLEKTSAVRVYVGPSIGFTLMKMAVGDESKSTTGFTWGGTVGILWKASDHIDVDIGYRYMDAKVDISDWDVNSSLKINMLSAGVSFKF
jgi:opacity protein-like surface antigen